MTNFEKYKDEILQLSKESKVIALKNGTPVSCDSFVYCMGCGFRADEEIKFCAAKRTIWLYDEFKEPIKLTHKQLAILQILETGWLARDDVSNRLYWYSEKPKRVNYHFENARAKSMSIRGVFDAFDFITFKDEPFSVEEMLKWEVVND